MYEYYSYFINSFCAFAIVAGKQHRSVETTPEVNNGKQFWLIFSAIFGTILIAANQLL